MRPTRLYQFELVREAAHVAVEAARVANSDTEAAELEKIARDSDELFQRQLPGD